VKLLQPEDELVVFGPKRIEMLVSQLNRGHVRFFSDSAFSSVLGRIVWQQVALPRLILRFGTEVLFSPYDIGPWMRHCPLVLGVRNPTPIMIANGSLKPFFSKTIEGPLHQALVRRTCRAATFVIFPSRFAADNVGDLLGVARDKRRVVYHGLDTEFWLEPKSVDAGLPNGLSAGKYVLFASKFYSQKRAGLLLDAFHMWRRIYGRTDYKLVFCGEDFNSKAAAAMRARIAALDLTSAVYLMGIVDRPTLRLLYRHANQVVLPTVLETFGFPYVEAMASGTPLVCADIDVARELCGEAAYYFGADDKEALAEAMERAATDPERPRKLAIGFERAKHFSWQKEAQETLECLRDAAAQPRRALSTVSA
jgi:glycosyltransferase involved in cell wall biosynthesis